MSPKFSSKIAPTGSASSAAMPFHPNHAKLVLPIFGTPNTQPWDLSTWMMFSICLSIIARLCNWVVWEEVFGLWRVRLEKLPHIDRTYKLSLWLIWFSWHIWGQVSLIFKSTLQCALQRTIGYWYDIQAHPIRYYQIVSAVKHVASPILAVVSTISKS